MVFYAGFAIAPLTCGLSAGSREQCIVPVAMSDDPSGYYATLDVHPRADLAAIVVAFRRKARVLHPDVPGSGNAEAFMRIKAAYDVVGDVERRAAYDRAAHAAMSVVQALPEVSEPALRWPRPSDLPPAVWAAFGCVLLVSLAMTWLHLRGSPPVSTGPTIRAAAAPGPSTGAPPKPASLPASGPSSHYVSPGLDAVLWRYDAMRNAFVPAWTALPHSARSRH
jgi:curved DNA-binding protein CbpA